MIMTKVVQWDMISIMVTIMTMKEQEKMDRIVTSIKKIMTFVDIYMWIKFLKLIQSTKCERCSLCMTSLVLILDSVTLEGSPMPLFPFLLSALLPLP